MRRRASFVFVIVLVAVGGAATACVEPTTISVGDAISPTLVKVGAPLEAGGAFIDRKGDYEEGPWHWRIDQKPKASWLSAPWFDSSDPWDFSADALGRYRICARSVDGRTGEQCTAFDAIDRVIASPVRTTLARQDTIIDGDFLVADGVNQPVHIEHLSADTKSGAGVSCPSDYGHVEDDLFCTVDELDVGDEVHFVADGTGEITGDAAHVDVTLDVVDGVSDGPRFTSLTLSNGALHVQGHVDPPLIGGLVGIEMAVASADVIRWKGNKLAIFEDARGAVLDYDVPGILVAPGPADPGRYHVYTRITSFDADKVRRFGYAEFDVDVR